MARHESYPLQITCSVCGQKGLAEIKERENFVHSRGKEETRVENVLSGNFQLAHGKLTCGCGEPVSID